MKNVLILGLGGSGANVADAFFADRNTDGNDDKRISCLALDTDMETERKCKHIPVLLLTGHTTLGNLIARLGEESVEDYFPSLCGNKDGYLKTIELGKGTGGWRMSGLLSLDFMLFDEQKSAAFKQVLDGLIDEADPYNPIEIVLVSSLAGGTGSALFLPLALYLRRYFQTKYGRDVAVKALLACPDVYAGGLREGRIKAFSNAYAALAELNAADLVSKDYNKRAKEEGRAQVRFRIGSEKSKGLGVLLDASRSDNAFAQPFSSVYLFDRIPATETVSAHERIMAKILGIILEDNKMRGSKEIYTGISIAEVRFAGEKIVGYIATKKVLCDLNGEWMPLYLSARREARSGDVGGLSDPEDEQYVFAKRFTDAYKKKYGEESFDQHFALGREKFDETLPPETKNGEPIVPIGHIYDFYQDMVVAVRELAQTGAELINKARENKDKDILPLKFFDSRETKSKKIEAVKNKAAYYLELILSYFKTGTRVIFEQSKTMKIELLDPERENSLYRRILYFNGRALHPVTALLVLSELYLAVKQDLRRQNPLCKIKRPYGGKELPEIALEKDADEEKDDPFDAIFPNRLLKNIVKTDVKKLPRTIVADFPQIKEDFESLYFTVKALIEDALKNILLRTVGEVIERFLAMFDEIPSLLSEHKGDEERALLDCATDSCTLMNVGCSKENKEEAYRRFQKERSGEHTDDAKVGEIFLAYALEERGVQGLYGALIEAEREEALRSTQIKDACGENIFRVLHERDIFKEELALHTAHHDFKRATAFTALPLDVEQRDETELKEGETPPRSETVMRIPQAAADFAQKMMHDTMIPLEMAVRKYLFMQAGSESEIEITDDLPQNCIMTVNKIYDFKLQAFNKVNEHAATGYYKFYQEAVRLAREQGAVMWDPHIELRKPDDFLPYIDGGLRESFGVRASKAMLYLLWTGKLAFECPEERGRFVFCGNGAREEVETQGEAPLIPLLRYLYGRADLAESFSAAFDHEIDRDADAFPNAGYSRAEFAAFGHAVWDARFLRFLRGNLAANVDSAKKLSCKLYGLIFALSEKEESAFEAKGLKEAVTQAIDRLIRSRPLPEESLAKKLLHGIEGELKNGALRDANTQTTGGDFEQRLPQTDRQ